MTVRRSLLIAFLQRNIAAVAYLATTIVIARLLSPTEIGIFSLCAAVITISSTFREFGIAEYIVQEKHLDEHKLRAAYGVAIAVGWSTGGFLLAVRSLLADYYQQPGVADVLGVLSINFFILPLATPAFAILSRNMAFGSIFVIQTAAGLSGSLASVVLAWAGLSYMSLAWGSVVTNVVQLIGVAWMRPRESWLWPSFSGSQSIWRYCLAYSGTMFLEVGTRHSRDFILARQFGFAAVGLYSRAQGLIDQFHNTVTVAASSVVTPLLALENRSGHSLRERYGIAVTLFTALAWPFAGFCGVVSADIIGVLFGPKWAEAAPLASIICGCAAISATSAFAPNVLAATGNIKARLSISLIVSPCVVAAYLIGASHSVAAVAVMSMAPLVLALALYAKHLRKIIGFTLGDLVRAARGSAFVALCVVVSAWAMNGLASSTLGGQAGYLAVKSAVGLVVWLLACHIIRHPINAEVARVASLVMARFNGKART